MSRDDGRDFRGDVTGDRSSHQELKSLLAPYALDAVDELEARALQAHLKVCSECTQELEEFREVTAKLASTPVAAPLELWEKIASQIDEPPLPQPAPRLRPLLRESKLPRWARSSRQLATAFASLAALVIVLLGIDVAHLSGQVSSLRSVGASAPGIAAVASSALANPTTKVYQLMSTSGVPLADIAVDRQHAAYVIPRHLQALPASQTYQLWAVSHGTLISLGVLGSHPRDFWTNLVPQITAIVINVEPAGGTQAPTSKVLGSVTLA